MEDLAKASLSCLFCIAESTCGCLTIIFGYYLLTQQKKVGFIVMWLGTLFYALTLQILGPEGAIVSIFMSSEIILNIFVTFAVSKQLKDYS